MLHLPQSDAGRRRTARQIGDTDPVFAMIAEHKKLTAAWHGLYDRLEEAEFAAASKHGSRPNGLIHWRNYTIGGYEIDVRRENLIAEGIDPATVEQEYLDAKARYHAQLAAGPAWDKRAGLAKHRKDFDRALAAERRLGKRLSRTFPTTPGGAAALIQYILQDGDLVPDETYWHMTALRSVAAALNGMTGAVRS